MKYLMIVLLIVTVILQNPLVAGGGQSKAYTRVTRQDGTAFPPYILSRSQELLNDQVCVVPSNFRLVISDAEFDAFICSNTRPNDNQTLVRAYYQSYRETGAILPECRIPLDGLVAQGRTTLAELLKKVDADTEKEKIIDRVIRFDRQRMAMAMYAPRGQHGLQAQPAMVDNTAQFMACIVALSK